MHPMAADAVDPHQVGGRVADRQTVRLAVLPPGDGCKHAACMALCGLCRGLGHTAILQQGSSLQCTYAS